MNLFYFVYLRPRNSAFDFYTKIGFECIGEEDIELDFGYLMEDFKMLKKLR